MSLIDSEILLLDSLCFPKKNETVTHTLFYVNIEIVLCYEKYFQITMRKKFIRLFCLKTENHTSVKLQKFLELQVKM